MPRPATASGPAHKALHDALERHGSPCQGVDTFTADAPTPNQIARMKRLCGGCPVRALCANVARIDRPTAGFWAGRLRTESARKARHAQSA